MPENTRGVGFCGSCMGCPWMSAGYGVAAAHWQGAGPASGRIGRSPTLQKAAQLAPIDDAKHQDGQPVDEQARSDQRTQRPEAYLGAARQTEPRLERLGQGPQGRR